MIQRLLSFLDASPVNFLAAKNISDMLEADGFRRVDQRQPLGEVKAGGTHWQIQFRRCKQVIFCK